MDLGFVTDLDTFHEFTMFKYEHLDIISDLGTVHKVQHKKTGEILAVKEEVDGLTMSTITEIDILKSLPSHPHIVEFKEVVAYDPDRVFVVMEFVETDLERYMNDIRTKHFNLSESEVKLLMKQLLDGIQFLHEHGIMHRDLKPSNILMNINTEQLKICDFGLSLQFEEPREYLGSYAPGVETRPYSAPELLDGADKYLCAIDMWSMGCIMAELLLNELLFQNIDDILDIVPDMLLRQKFLNNMLRQKFLINAAAFSGAPLLTELGFDLLQKLLTLNPNKRITAKEALNHPWFRD